MVSVILLFFAFVALFFLSYLTIFHTAIWTAHNAYQVILLLVCTTITYFYVKRFRKRNWREIPYLKIFLVTTVYFVMCILLPAMDRQLWQKWRGLESIQIVWLLFGLYLFIFGIALLFDTKDVQVDAPQCKTIPQIMGEKKAALLAFMLLLPLLGYLCFYSSGVAFLFLLVCLSAFGFFYVFYHRKELFLPVFGDAMLACAGVACML